MNISGNAEKALNKSYLFAIKILKKLAIEGTNLNIIRAI